MNNLFFNSQHKDAQDSYISYLRIIGSLSFLFSDSKTPYLYYRAAERIFCKAFSAEDMSRSDVSADAKHQHLGIGLKTFISSSVTSNEKIAEFNKENKNYKHYDTESLIRKISDLRNMRIEFTKRTFGIESMIYHCIHRNDGVFRIIEEEMLSINIAKISNINIRNNIIHFDDGNREYTFNRSKSTLYQKFDVSKPIHEFEVKIIADPLLELSKLLHAPIYASRSYETVYLPLYGDKKKVYPRSGLNQWNAAGRDRNINEVYIPIPVWIHNHFPSFFPNRNTPFTLRLPNGKELQAKICQEGGKALMSYSNRELGKWILRDVLNIKEGIVIEYRDLEDIGIDSVRIDKISDNVFDINFSKLDSFEDFANKND